MVDPMISTTPYLIRAIYDWCQDQSFTPHLLVDTTVEGVIVPQHLIENDTIVLNIQSSAVKGLELGNEWLVFNARFSGQPMDVSVPVTAVRAIFARENGQGYAFETPAELTPEETARALEELNAEIDTEQASVSKPPKAKAKAKAEGARKKSHLKLVD